MEEITGAANQKIKDLGRLMRERKFRNETGLFAVEGAMLAKEAARSRCQIKSVFYTAKAREKYGEEITAAADKAVSSYLITEWIAAKVSSLSSPQGIFTIVESPLDGGSVSGKRAVVLDGVQNPDNLGAIARSALAFGFGSLFVSPDSADWRSCKAQRASAGALLHCSVTVSETPESIGRLKAGGFFVCAAAITGGAADAGKLTAAEKTAIVIGNEAAGLSDAVISACDAAAVIPTGDRMPSLNAAAAAAVMMYLFREGALCTAD